MVLSKKERTTESNKGLVKPFTRPDTSFSAQIQLHVNGKFKNYGFRDTLEPGLPRLPPVKPADMKPLFRFIQPEKVSGWERTGYQMAKGQLRHANEVAAAKEYQEYLGARTAADAKFAATSVAKLSAHMNTREPPPNPAASTRDVSSLAVPSLFSQQTQTTQTTWRSQATSPLSSSTPIEPDPSTASSTSYTPRTARPTRLQIATSNLRQRPDYGERHSPMIRDFQRRGPGTRYIEQSDKVAGIEEVSRRGHSMWGPGMRHVESRSSQGRSSPRAPTIDSSLADQSPRHIRNSPSGAGMMRNVRLSGPSSALPPTVASGSGRPTVRRYSRMSEGKT